MTAEMFISKELISKVFSLTDKVILTSFFAFDFIRLDAYDKTGAEKCSSLLRGQQ